MAAAYAHYKAKIHQSSEKSKITNKQTICAAKVRHVVAVFSDACIAIAHENNAPSPALYPARACFNRLARMMLEVRVSGVVLLHNKKVSNAVRDQVMRGQR